MGITPQSSHTPLKVVSFGLPEVVVSVLMVVVSPLAEVVSLLVDSALFS